MITGEEVVVEADGSVEVDVAPVARILFVRDAIDNTRLLRSGLLLSPARFVGVSSFAKVVLAGDGPIF